MLENINRQNLYQAIQKFPAANILVIGDIIVDHFIWGTVSRISPEAPVPVVNVTAESLLLGGSANVLHNLYDLGARATLCGVVGDDFRSAIDLAPALTAELLRRGWPEQDVRKALGLNVLRVMRRAETVAARLQKERPPSLEP